MTLKTAFAVVVLASISCGGSTLGGSGGSGGAGPTGVAGTSAGGTGGSPSIEARVPRCLADLVAPCTCQWAGGSCGVQTCFAAGVTTATTDPEGGACNSTNDWSETRVYKPDGSLCFSVRRSYRMNFGCESGTITWWDAAGQMVATADGYGGQNACGIVTPTISCSAVSEGGVAPDPWPNYNCPANACP